MLVLAAGRVGAVVSWVVVVVLVVTGSSCAQAATNRVAESDNIRLRMVSFFIVK